MGFLKELSTRDVIFAFDSDIYFDFLDIQKSKRVINATFTNTQINKTKKSST